MTRETQELAEGISEVAKNIGFGDDINEIDHAMSVLLIPQVLRILKNTADHPSSNRGKKQLLHLSKSCVHIAAVMRISKNDDMLKYFNTDVYNHALVYIAENTARKNYDWYELVSTVTALDRNWGAKNILVPATRCALMARFERVMRGDQVVYGFPEEICKRLEICIKSAMYRCKNAANVGALTQGRATTKIPKVILLMVVKALVLSNDSDSDSD